MGRIEKAYFTLEEVAERWQLPNRDLVYLAENGLLRLSVRLFQIWLEFGTIEGFEPGRWERIPYDHHCFTGLQDLLNRDAFRVFREGCAEVFYFHAPDHEYVHIREPSAALIVHPADLVIRREERDRVEAKHGLVRAGGESKPTFQQFNDYHEVYCGGHAYRFGAIQAAIVKRLHVAAKDGRPWCLGKLLLNAVGSASMRMSDVFKSQPHWRRLILSDRRGNYRLNLPER